MDAKKMLEFAYKARDMFENAYLTAEQAHDMREIASRGEWSRNEIVYPEYGEIYEMINALEDEIKYKEAKASGKNSERKRTSAAKKILKSVISGNVALQGYKKINDKEIALCNGYVLFVGDSVIGINETKKPDGFIDVDRVWPQDYGYKETILTKEDVANIRSRYLEGRAETGLKKAEEITKAGSQKCLFFIGESKEECSAFNSDFILWASDLIGGDEMKLKYYGKKKALIMEGEHGRFLALPINYNTKPERMDKEVL